MSTRAPLVVKIGSSTLLGEDVAVRREWLTAFAADLLSIGRPVVIVSSGAIALGARRLALAKGGRASLDDAQAAAAVGQIALASEWAAALAQAGRTAAQLLLTVGDLEDRRRYLNMRATLDRLLACGAIPVINENDTVATEEICFGDNDRLAARVAAAIGAETLVLLSDVDGLFDRDPRRDATATPIALVEDIDDVAGLAGDSASALGTGGMAAKIEAARIATRAGVGVIVADGDPLAPLSRALTGAGTRFVARGGSGARKSWLASLRPVGRVRMDGGAAAALARGASLLPAGIVEVQGRFVRGDSVDLLGEDGREMGRGLVEYDACDLARIAGCRGDAVSERLGQPPRRAAVHRDQLVLL